MWQLVFSASESQPELPVVVPLVTTLPERPPEPKPKRPVSIKVQISPTRGDADDEEDDD